MTEILSSQQHKLKFYLDKALELEQADAGLIRLYDFSNNALKVVLDQGLDKDFPEHLLIAKPFDSTACGRAAGLCKIVVIADVLHDIGLMPHHEALTRSGFRAVKSIPLIHVDGTLRGILCLICKRPRWSWENNILTELIDEITACIS